MTAICNPTWQHCIKYILTRAAFYSLKDRTMPMERKCLPNPNPTPWWELWRCDSRCAKTSGLLALLLSSTIAAFADFFFRISQRTSEQVDCPTHLLHKQSIIKLRLVGHHCFFLPQELLLSFELLCYTLILTKYIFSINFALSHLSDCLICGFAKTICLSKWSPDYNYSVKWWWSKHLIFQWTKDLLACVATNNSNCSWYRFPEIQ